MRIRYFGQAACSLAVILVGTSVAFGADEAPEVTPPFDSALITVPGSSVLVRTWDAADATGDIRPHYAVSMDGGRSFSDPRPTSYTIELRYGSFDPLELDLLPPVAPELEAGPDTNLYLVQFVTQPLEAYRDAITGLGADVSFYMPNHTHLVRMSPETRAAVADQAYVRWVGSFHPAYRLEEFLLELLDQAEGVAPDLKYNIMLTDADLVAKQSVAARIAELGGVVHRAHAGKYLLEATLSPDQLREVVRFDEVVFVDRWSEGETDMDMIREIGGANYIESVAGYTGTGVRGEVLDIGFNLIHTDFAGSLITHTSVGSDSHGASTSGVIFGKGIVDSSARGLLPDGQGIVAAWSQVSTGPPRYDHTGELVQPQWSALFQSSSVGSAWETQYSTISADTDAALFDFDIVHLQSQSNTGSTQSRPQAWAKNIISVGGIRSANTASFADDCWCGLASIGPAADGRIKPDISHYNDSIRTTSCCGSASYTSSFGGTSGATPVVAGHIGLIFEMWADGAFGNPVDVGASVFENRCHMTTAKALMINTARQYSFSGGSSDMTRVHQGWGVPDLKSLYNGRFGMLIVDETDLLMNMQSRAYLGTVLPGEPALKATLVYADPPGTPFSSVHRVNDLTLKVTSPGGDVYWGNNGLRTGNWSTLGGSANTVDTVENVFVENPGPGQWLIEVFADEINQDGHVETLSMLDADYALVVSGVEEELPPLFARLLSSVPSLVLPGEPVEVTVEFIDGEETIVPGSEELLYRFSPDDEFTIASLEDLGASAYLATVPGASCGDTPEFYMRAEGDSGTVVTLPSDAPDDLYGYDVGETVIVLEDDFEHDEDWDVENIDVIDGKWQRGIPIGGGDAGDPPFDGDGSGQCWMTGKGDNSDMDGGPTILTSPPLDVTGLDDPIVSYLRWFTNDDGPSDPDRLVVEISGDDGGSWSTLEIVDDGDIGWTPATFRVFDFVVPTGPVRVRFTAADQPNDSITEAAIDAFVMSSLACEGDDVPGDVNGDGVVDFTDLLAVLASWGDCPPGDCPADFDGSGVVDFTDLLTLLASWS